MIFAHTIADLLSLATSHFDPEDPSRCVHNLLGAITDPLYDLIDRKKIIGALDYVMMTLNENVES